MQVKKIRLLKDLFLEKPAPVIRPDQEFSKNNDLNKRNKVTEKQLQCDSNNLLQFHRIETINKLKIELMKDTGQNDPITKRYFFRQTGAGNSAGPRNFEK